MCDHSCAIVLCMGTPTCPHGSARMRGILSTTCVNQVNLSVTNGIRKRDSRKFERDYRKRDFTYVRTYWPRYGPGLAASR